MGVTLKAIYGEANKKATARIGVEREGASPEVQELLDVISKQLLKGITAGQIRKMMRPSKRAEAEFKAQTGSTLAAYIKEQRLVVAKWLLENSGISVAEIAKHTQVALKSRFSSIFTRWAGQTPTEVRDAANARPEDLDRLRQCWFGPQLLAVKDPAVSKQARQINDEQRSASLDYLWEPLLKATVDGLEAQIFAAHQK